MVEICEPLSKPIVFAKFPKNGYRFWGRGPFTIHGFVKERKGRGTERKRKGSRGKDNERKRKRKRKEEEMERKRKGRGKEKERGGGKTRRKGKGKEKEDRVRLWSGAIYFLNKWVSHGIATVRYR